MDTLHLTRRCDFYFCTYIDRLTSTYNGNRVIGLSDASGDIAGVVDYPGSPSTMALSYDNNGNLNVETHKLIETSYNLLNLPKELIWLGLNRRINYYYNFGGAKLRKRVENNGTLTKVDYCGPFVYETASGVRSLKYLVTPYGRAVKTGSTWDFEYNLTDHLGNVRAVIRKGSNNLAELIQQKHYYPFGMEMSNISLGTGTNKYLYNGKEIQDDFNLYWYDYGARFYDPQLGRWHSVDPLAEMYIGISPYTFTANNPINNREIDGRYFDEKRSAKQADRIERKADMQAGKFDRRADKIDQKGGNSGDLRDRAGELRQSAQDVRDMRNDASTEYKYAKLNGKEGKSLGLGGPSTTLTGQNGKGDNVVTMFSEKNMGNQIHETRHGGQNARGEFNVATGAGYGVADEVSAYRAQYSWDGSLKYMPFTEFGNKNNLMQMMTQGIQSFFQNITNINQITPNFVNTLVDNPGLNQILIYPPPSIPLNIWNSN
jgi:RHS repeat-associated protein